MKTDHEEQLETHRSALVQNMNPEEVIDELRSHQVLTARDEDEIPHAKVKDAQNAKLLDYLLRKPDTAFEIFRGALRRTGQSHLARLLGWEVVLTISEYSRALVKFWTHALRAG